MIIDTHCHLIDKAFEADVDKVVSRALEADVQKMILACCDETEFPSIVELCQRYPDRLYPTIGIHPENMSSDIEAQLKQLKSALTNYTGPCIRAIGEIGLDLYWDKSRLTDQLWLLEKQVEWALESDLPVLLHIRNAMDEFLELLKSRLHPMAETMGKQVKGILHCYSGTADQAIEAMQYGHFLLGIGGTLTYKKSQVPEVVRTIGLKHLVLETDAPYLAPVPHRGKRNEPAFTAVTCQMLAELSGTTATEAAKITSKNASELFGF
ncbi:MAG: TatD family hydrolase [Bacteroidales bacterium]|nr:TatD family hydrolase [Bacteroidales bacterium]